MPAPMKENGIQIDISGEASISCEVSMVQYIIIKPIFSKQITLVIQRV